MGPSAVKAVVFWLLIGVSSLLLWQVVKPGSSQQAVPEISYSQFMSDVDAGAVARVTISGNQVRAQYGTEGRTVRVVAPHSQEAMLAALRSRSVEIWFKDSDSSNGPAQLLGTWAPLILLAALWFFMIRQMQRSAKTRDQGVNTGTSEGLR